MHPWLAAAPIGAILVLTVGLGRSAVSAGLFAAALTLLLAVTAFDLGGPAAPGGPAAGVVGVAAEAVFVTLTVVAIIGPALGLHHLQQRTGATDVLRRALARLTPDPRIAALLIAWFFSLFLEGAAGFGTPVALAAPFLVAAGFAPVTAVCAALVGHAAGVSFGALGTPVLAQVALTGFSGQELARATVLYHAMLGWLLTASVVLILGRALPGHRPPWAWGAVAAAGFFGPFFLIGWFVGPELPTLGGALVGTIAFVLLLQMRSRYVPGEPPGSGGVGHPTRTEVVRAASPYLALVGLVALTRGIPAVSDALFDVVVEWQLFDDFTGSVRPLYHPGMLLLLAVVVGAVAQGASLGIVCDAVRSTSRRLAPVTIALVAMVTVARGMSHAGMIDELASSAAGVGAAWPLLAPAVGALGTFVTGSATASNILFTDFQQATAEAVDRAPLPLLGAQGFGAAVGNIICPHNVVAAAATVGLVGHEGAVLRRTLPIALGYLTLGGLLAWIL